MSSKCHQNVTRLHSLLRPAVLAHSCGGLADTAPTYCAHLLIPLQMIIPKLIILLGSFISTIITYPHARKYLQVFLHIEQYDLRKGTSFSMR